MLRFLSIAILILVSTPSSAQTNFYVEFAPGVSVLQDVDASGDGISGEIELDTGFVVGGSVGAYVLDSIRAELAVNYRQFEVDQISSGGLSGDGAADVSSTTLMANALYDLKIFDLGVPITPYIGTGIGAAFLEVDPNSNCALVCVDDKTSEFSWNLMLGVSADVMKNVALSLGYRYLGTTEPEFEEAGVKIEADDPLAFHEILFGIRYSF